MRVTELNTDVAALLKRNPDGLVPAIVQDATDGRVLMLAWMDDEALRRTLTTRQGTYWSRSRQSYWVKGEISGNTQAVREVRLDCDGDTLLVRVDQRGPACHTGADTCFDDRLLLTLGARWQRVKVDDWTNDVKGVTGYDEEKVSPSGGLLFKATDKLSLYANYMEGLSQGKIAPSTSRNENQIFPPFISRQVEVGAKYDAGAVALTAAVFRIRQPAYETNATTRLFGPNGKRQNQGVELSVFGEPLKGVRLLGGVMYTDSELTDTTNGTYDGNRAPATPKYNVNLGAEWDVPGLEGLTLSSRGLYSRSQYLDASNVKQIDAWTRLDVGARYGFKVDDKRITLRANVENVADRRYWSSAGASDDSEPGLTLSTPRTYLLSATIDF